MGKWITPEVKALLGEFLKGMTVPGYTEEQIKEIWSSRDDLAEAMQGYIEDTRNHPNNGEWVDEASRVFPDAKYWQFASFRICARRAFRRLEVKEEALMVHLPNFGMF